MRAGRKSSWRARLWAPVLLALWALALVLAVGDVLDRLSVPSWGNPRGEARSAELNEATKLGQSFVAPLPGLAAVQVTVDAAASMRERHVTIRLREGGEGDPELGARRVAIPLEASATQVRLDLAPVYDSKGKAFYLSLEADAPPGEGVTVAHSPAAEIEGSSAHLNGRPVVGVLQFQTYYSPRTRDKFGLVLTSLVADGFDLPRSKGVYIGVGVAYACALGLYVWQTAHTVQDEQDGKP